MSTVSEVQYLSTKERITINCQNCGKDTDTSQSNCAHCGAAIPNKPGSEALLKQVRDTKSAHKKLQTSRKQVAPLKFKRIDWLAILFLSIITLGVYPYYWYLKRTESFNALSSPKKLSKALLRVMTSIMLLSLLSFLYTTIMGATQAPHYAILLLTLIDLASFITSIMIIFVAFRARRILLDHTEAAGNPLIFSGFWTFILNNIYLQYKINDLIDDSE